MKLRVAVALLSLLAVGACRREDPEERARRMAEEVQAALGDVQAAALAQKVAPETVREAQQHLRTLGEYLGEVNGVLDAVTVNAVQAFQTAEGLEPNGILDERTMARLREAAARRQQAGAQPATVAR